MSDRLDARNFKFLIRRGGSTRSIKQYRFLTPFQASFGKVFFCQNLGFDINGLDRVGVPG